MIWNPSIIINNSAEYINVLNPKVSLSITDFLGECNETQVNNVELYAMGECLGNALMPSIPNPLKILDPVTGEALNTKLKYLNFFPLDSNGQFSITKLLSLEFVGKILNSIWGFPIIILNTFLEVLFGAIKFLLVFIVRFWFTYMFWVSLGFQAILNYTQTNHNLESEEKIRYTVFLMIIGSLFTLSYGGDWIKW